MDFVWVILVEIERPWGGSGRRPDHVRAFESRIDSRDTFFVSGANGTVRSSIGWMPALLQEEARTNMSDAMDTTQTLTIQEVVADIRQDDDPGSIYTDRFQASGEEYISLGGMYRRREPVHRHPQSVCRGGSHRTE